MYPLIEDELNTWYDEEVRRAAAVVRCLRYYLAKVSTVPGQKFASRSDFTPKSLYFENLLQHLT